ncbi:MAG TPA: aminotransferase class V-fold PLP-dependent enzyme [Saprospiraceae bacterium]|nr:aminotransferase class V-fold PLP-dependent enzyme [Saprospiraceae bacterium]
MKNKTISTLTAETLDPTDWENLRQLGHQMVDDMVQFLQTIGEQPVWRKPSEAAKQHLQADLPQAPQDLTDVYADFKKHVLPFYNGNIHPRFWGWVKGTGSMQSALAEMLAATMNPNVSLGDQGAIYVDKQVIEWCKQMMRYPAGASGMLVSGASMANATALLVARNAFDAGVRREGLQGRASQWVVYASTETHSCIPRAVEMLGLGTDALHQIRVDENYALDMKHLRERIAEDEAAGLLPFCVVANAGTVNTGATDPLEEMVAFCREKGLWLHVDGAFGALAGLLPEYESSLKWISRADSIAFDLHKWMYLPYGVGCVLVRDGDTHRRAFEYSASYLMQHERGIPAGPEGQSNYGLELSRDFKALKVWMSLKEHGIDKFRRLIRQNIQQAGYLAERIAQMPDLQLMAPAPLNIVCFRYNPGSLNPEELNALNKEILMQLHESGIAAPSYTVLQGSYCLRAAITNHRTTTADLEVLIEAVLKIGEKAARLEAAEV